MKKHYYIIFSFFICTLLLYSIKVSAILPLTGITIVIDPGHGDKDPGAYYNNIYEKDINLLISIYIKENLIKYGANVILTREEDYDLSSPNSYHRKKSDFDNRIKLINNSDADIYLSIHLNFFNNPIYKGPQVFYDKNNSELASAIQNALNKALNGKRDIKPIPNETYMYNKLNKAGVLIECGFLSNPEERELLLKSEYQKRIANAIVNGLLTYY